MTKQEIKDKVENIFLNNDVDNPYIKLDVLTDWIYDEFVSLTSKEREVAGWIKDWTDLFPKKTVQQIWSSPKDCLKKMVKFVKDYPEYDKDCIFAATSDYLSEKSEKNYEFTKKATNLIHRQGEGSTLATLCEQQKDKEILPVKEQLNNFFY